MKYSGKIFFLVIAVFFYFLHSIVYIDYNELAQFSDYLQETQIKGKENLITISSNFPFRFSLNGKNDLSANNLIQNENKKILFRFLQIQENEHNKFLYSNQQYIFNINYLYQKEKKSDLIYPFHFFM